MTDARPTKIWYQSFIEPGRDRPYFDKLGAFLRTLAAPGVSYELNGIDPPNQELHRITEFRCAAQVVRNALRAQVEGYDAFAIGHYQDSGLYEARATVRIPVLGMGEASMLFACSLGRNFALVGIDPIFIPIHEECVARYGLRDRYVGIQVVETKVQDLVDAFTDPEAPERMFTQFREQVQPLVDAGAEVIIPAGGLFATLFSGLKGLTVGKAIVLNPISVLAKWTELAVFLKRVMGTGTARALSFPTPSEKAVREFLDSLA